MSRFAVLGVVGLVGAMALGMVPGLSASPADSNYLVWDSPTRIDASVYGESMPFAPDVVMDSEGNAIAVWFQVRQGCIKICGGSVWANRFVPGYGWGPPIRIGENAWTEADSQPPAVAIGPEGAAVAAWVGSRQVWASYFTPGAGWHPAASIHPVEGYPRGPQVAIDNTGAAMVIWDEEFPDTRGLERHNLWATPFSASQGWAEPVLLEKKAEDWTRPDLAPRWGRSEFVAVWIRTRDGQESILAGQYTADQGWQVPILIGSDRDHVLTIGVAAGKHGAVTWAEGDSDGAEIWTAGLLFEPELNAYTPPRPGPEHEYSILKPSVSSGSIVTWCGHEDGHCHDVFVGFFSPGAHDHWIVHRVVTGVSETTVPTIASRSTEFTLDPGSRPGFILWAELTNSGERLERRIWASRSASNWAFHHEVSTSDYATDERVAVDPSGNAVVLWRQFHGDQATIWATVFLVEPVFDTTPPALSITSPSDRFTTSVPTVTVAGFTEPGAILVVNGIRVDLGPDGSFRLHLALSEGSNTIAATSTDAAGNVATASVQVTYQSSLPALEDQIRDTNDALAAANAALAAANQKIFLLLLLQVGLAASVAFGLVFSRIRLRRGPGSGGSRFGKDDQGGNPGTNDSIEGESVAPPHNRDRKGVWPEMAAVGDPLHVTAKERVLIHLLGLANHERGLDVPEGLTQSGVAMAAGFNRRHFTQYARPLIRQGLIQERTAHVEGSLQRRKVYGLTEKGKGAALRVRNRVASAVVRIKDSSGVREAAIAELLPWVPRSHSLLEIVREAIETGAVTLET